jgi:glycosyltransferase involved in cell wall biosynthesis
MRLRIEENMSVRATTDAGPTVGSTARSARSTGLIVIPAYNEERNVVAVIEDLRRIVPGYDRLVVNDGASDGTARVLDEIGERQLRLPCNLGYGRALQAGLRYALQEGYEVIITFDADGQHRADDVPLMVNALIQRNADLVIGARFGNGRPYSGPFDRRIGQQIFSWLTARITGSRVYDTTSGLKAMRHDACRAIVSAVSHDFHMETIVALSLSGFRIVEEPITMAKRVHGRSMHSLLSIVAYPLQTLLVTAVALLDIGRYRRAR